MRRLKLRGVEMVYEPDAFGELPGNELEKKKWVLDWELEEEQDPGGGILPLIDREYFFDLLMEEQKQM